MFRAIILTIVIAHCCGKVLKGINGRGAGECPYQRPAVSCAFNLSSDDELSCYSDEECSPSLKCCQQGCTTKCVKPVHYSKWCSVPVDLGILFDPKTSKRTIDKVLKAMSLTEGRTHVSLATTDGDTILSFNEHLERGTSRVLALRTVNPETVEGGLVVSLGMAKDMFTKENGGREGSIKVLLVFSDGIIDEDDSPGEASDSLRDAGILVEAISLSHEVDLFSLLQIATSDRYIWKGVTRKFLRELRKLEKKPCY